MDTSRWSTWTLPTRSWGPAWPGPDGTPGPGVDLILAQGTDIGGHTGGVATMVLVPVVANLDGPPARAGPGLLTSLQLCVIVGYGVCRNP